MLGKPAQISHGGYRTLAEARQARTAVSVLPATQHKAAEATARLILTNTRSARAKMTAKNKRRHRQAAATGPDVHHTTAS
jgi:hypothetical protein